MNNEYDTKLLSNISFEAKGNKKEILKYLTTKNIYIHTYINMNMSLKFKYSIPIMLS